MKHTFDLNPIFGSHRGMLQRALEPLAPGSLVIEHGAGTYSSPLIARFDVRVLCIEEQPGWAEWARWIYGDRATMIDRAKHSIPKMADAALVFIDGATRERGDMLIWSLAAGVPCVVAHDTDEDNARMYGYHRHLDKVAGYAIEHDVDRPRTTTWRRS